MTQLQAAWLSWPDIQRLAQCFAGAGAELRFVGGAVRDTLLGREVQDVDAATPLLPEEVMALLARAHIKALPTGLAHGTVTAVLGAHTVEITTLRKDTACDGRHAQVTFTDDWQEDARRRDFTMNALYLTPAGELFDYVNGVADARDGTVRFIGTARERIREDYLRILRYFRFHAHYGRSQPDPAIVQQCAQEAAGLAALSGERIQQELIKLLAATNYAGVLPAMQGPVLTQALAMPVKDMSLYTRLSALERQVEYSIPPAVKLVVMALSMPSPLHDWQRLSQRLRLSGALHDAGERILNALAEFTPGKPLLRRLGNVQYKAVLLCHAASQQIALREEEWALVMHWQPPLFPLSGKDLLALGLVSGKALGEQLDRLEAQWEASDYTLTREELLARAQR